MGTGKRKVSKGRITKLTLNGISRVWFGLGDGLGRGDGDVLNVGHIGPGNDALLTGSAICESLNHGEESLCGTEMTDK